MRRVYLSAALLGALIMFAGIQSSGAAGCPDLLNHKFQTLQGGEVDLCGYKDSVIVVVNTASKCGYTYQYEQLESLYEKRKDQGLMIIGFPSNDFNQEYGSDEKVEEFCRLTYSIKFPMAQISSVKGAGANPFYKALAEKTGAWPKWNFYKYVISPGAGEVTVFPSKVEPESETFMKAVEKWLGE